MYRASAYNLSQNTLLKFASDFNKTSVNPNLYCCPIIIETMLNDGCFVDVNLGKLLTFDWEIRVNLKSFAPGEFPFSDLRVFERKLSFDKNTQLIIECDNLQENIAIAWREDIMKSPVVKRNVKKDGGWQLADCRETTYFKVFALNNLTDFKNMLSRAIDTSTYNHTIF